MTPLAGVNDCKGAGGEQKATLPLCYLSCPVSADNAMDGQQTRQNVAKVTQAPTDGLGWASGSDKYVQTHINDGSQAGCPSSAFL